MKLLFATGNNKKYELMKNRLKDINQIEVLMPRQIGVNIKVNENGKTVKISAKGLLAQALSHEIDHLNGILFVDKIIPGTLQVIEPEK